MKKEAIFIQKSIRVFFTAVCLIIFVSSILLLSKTDQNASALAPLSPFPTTFKITNTAAPTSTNTPSPTFTPALITGVLNCNTVAAGVTCANNGSYLDYNVNINVTGLTGGATAGNITIGTYTRGTSGGEMGMMSDFVHSETSGWPSNTVFSRVVIQPFDAAGVGYDGFSSGTGTNVSVTNNTADWRYIGGSGGGRILYL
jgi:hypothetical protein